MLTQWLNTRVVERNDMPSMLQRSPRCIVLRNSLRHAIGPFLCNAAAHNLGQRPCVWWSEDTYADGSKLPNELREILHEQFSNQPDSLEPQGYFFDGALVNFTTNEAPEVGWHKNRVGVAVQIYLHPDEPPDECVPNFVFFTHLFKRLSLQAPWSSTDHSILHDCYFCVLNLH